MVKKYYIPIIGTISAGKSTFLKAFLGIDVLETGATTTTKFICLIKNSHKTSFYHVIPKNQIGISFIKEGKEIKNIEKIKNKIEEINKTLSEKKGNKNDIFYMLETPIKNINNRQLLDKCYFMDIPGLNENNTNYIEDIFSLITINDILFEIMIFDSTSIGSDGILKIFGKLEGKNCLKKENNLYILNKIDQCEGGEEEIIDTFKKYFYDYFEDEKKINGNSRISINLSKNFFIPMNSLLYQAEGDYNENFYSFLLIELFSYKNSNKLEFSSFYEYLGKRLECIISRNNINNDIIEEELEKIYEDSNEMKIIKKSIDDINDIMPTLNISADFILGIKIEKSKTKKILKKFYIIHKLKINTNFIHSKSYMHLQDIINNITFNNNRLFLQKITIPEINKNNCNKIKILDEMNNFIRQNIRKQFSQLDSYIQTLNNNFYGRKIRISLIGNISVGKSTVLNSIIGENILPTKDSECTYRGVIIKHKNIDNFLLYKTKLKIIGSDSRNNEYYNFEEDNEPYCFGIENIKSYLKNKNSDERIEDQDAFIIIQGRLKIFDFIKLDQELIEKIEFIDLPGHNRANNTFNNNKYYEKILKFSNSCIYINEAKSIDDEDSVTRMKMQYSSDKQKIYYNLQNKFIYSCLFLVNKSDTIPKKEDREKIKKNLIKTIFEVEKNASFNDINISFFSAKYFNEFLEYYKRYVELIEQEPFILLKYLYDEWSSDKWYIGNFRNYIFNKVSDKIEEKFEINIDEIKIPEVPSDFYNKMKIAFNQLYYNKYRGIDLKEEDEIIKRLYYIHHEFKNKNFSNSNYSSTFFQRLKDVILFSNNLQRENLNNNVEEIFRRFGY